MLIQRVNDNNNNNNNYSTYYLNVSYMITKYTIILLKKK